MIDSSAERAGGLMSRRFARHPRDGVVAWEPVVGTSLTLPGPLAARGRLTLGRNEGIVVVARR